MNGDYLCMVPNNSIGKFTIKCLQRFLNKKVWRIRLRGRHSKRKNLAQEMGHNRFQYDSYVPLKISERIAVYIYRKRIV